MTTTSGIRPQPRTIQAKLTPATAITIAVDTQYVAAQGGRNISQGIYMMDNQVANGSYNEGSLELHTMTFNGSLIGFNAVPINPNTGDTVVISGFTVSQGSVFGSQGYPIEQSEPTPVGCYWIGQATSEGTQTYQIQIEITTGGIRPTTYFVNWDPFITAK